MLGSKGGQSPCRRSKETLRGGICPSSSSTPDTSGMPSAQKNLIDCGADGGVVPHAEQSFFVGVGAKVTRFVLNEALQPPPKSVVHASVTKVGVVGRVSFNLLLNCGKDDPTGRRTIERELPFGTS